ncbi:PREDICTED: cytoskeleton-associated protein 2-like [Chrysochloris asiatica]|uniref:Cytoskeleton-associated protein 2-like n=1 Tax=Chrysochloris asiatica TaxID=185453 RepID=A0A9B0X3Y4_CHRAS|nr:PREDICTED: cytoskeleton-associated protein 2-like [Chrysochloris asiatica]
MSIPALPRDLQLPPSQRTQRAFKEQRRKQLEQHLLKRKTLFEYKQDHQILSSRKQSVMTSKDQIQNGTNILKLKTKMANKENTNIPTQRKNNVTMEKNCILSESSSELTNSTLEIDTNNFEDGSQSLQLLKTKDDVPNQHMTFSQAFHLKKNNKKQIPTEKLKQEANKPKKLVLGSYCGQVVASKINSFRKPLQVKDESSTTNKKLSTNVSNASKPQPLTMSSVPVKGNRASDVTTITKIRSTASQNKLVRPPIRSHHDSGQDKQKQSIIRASANVTVRKGPYRKELVQLKTDISTVKTSFQDIKRNEARSKSIAPGNVTKPASSSNTKLIEKSKPTNQRRHTIAANANVNNKSAHPKETAEQRKAHLTEWKAGKGRVLKRLPSSVVTQPESEGQNGNPVRSFWTTMAEEDEQRLFTEKVNKTFSECLNLINEGCPKEEILVTLNDMVKNIPDATKLVKYWVCLARLEPVTSPIENIIAIYEKAILAGAQVR